MLSWWAFSCIKKEKKTGTNWSIDLIFKHVKYEKLIKIGNKYPIDIYMINHYHSNKH